MHAVAVIGAAVTPSFYTFCGQPGEKVDTGRQARTVLVADELKQ